MTRALTVLLLLICATAQAQDKPSIHGMLLFGDATLYASHLPMFHPPHDYQAIVAISLLPADAAAYRADRAQHPDVYYTLVPERFSLPKLVTGFSFRADLVRGHFERGGETLHTAVAVTAAKVLQFRKLDPQAKRKATQFLLFGSLTEAYAAHLIVGAPDFDQIASITAPKGVTADDLRAGVLVTAAKDGPLVAGEDASIKIGARDEVLHTNQQIYLETGDLKD